MIKRIRENRGLESQKTRARIVSWFGQERLINRTERLLRSLA